MVNIVLVGFGGVGKSIIKILYKDREYFKKNYGFDPKILAVCERDGCLLPAKGSSFELFELTQINDIHQAKNWVPEKSTIEVLSEIQADIMIECTWTNPKTGEPGISHVITALEHNMHISASNKAPFYLEYKKIKKLATDRGLIVGIESTVGSAIPCIAAKKSIAGTHIKSVRAILNGTSNYILSRMTSEHLSFDLALKEAQMLGYAEADPSLDIEGYDAAGKLVILANELLNWDCSIQDVEVKGITKITHQAIELATNSGYLVKHVGIAEDGRLSVGPLLVPISSPFAVSGTLNVIQCETENAGQILFTGRGAGGPEAASGIISDMINICEIKKLK